MTVGVLKIDGVKLFVFDIELSKGLITVTAQGAFHERTELREGSRFCLYGNDGALVAEGPFRHPTVCADVDPERPQREVTLTVKLPIRINYVT